MATGTKSSIHPTSRRTDISYFLPIIITAAFLVVLALTALLARCLYIRFKTLRITSSTSSSSWKSYHSSRISGSANSLNNHLYDDQDLDESDLSEQDRLLARRRSTSYYDANRSRAPVAVVVKQDSQGRPISTWSTASSVAAHRGEELSQWSKRRDDLLKIYGRSNFNTSSFATYDDLEEDPEQEQEQEDEQERVLQQGYPSEAYSPGIQSNELSMATKKGGNDVQLQDGVSGFGEGR
ncbi:hypothetical protein BGZ76_008132 [Entomortierella beljakovae]|nr:hypothetical protein BGZ76_008132 [Entomortierella beljakovae]